MLEGSRAEMREVYPASEGFIAIADRAPGEGLRLVADNGLFYEFVPVAELGTDKPTRHWLGTIELGVDYAIVLTTCAGLWSYVIGDVVRFVDKTPPRLIITGRTSTCYRRSASMSWRADRNLRAGCGRGDRRADQRVFRRHAVPRERHGRARPPRVRRRVQRGNFRSGAPRRLHRRDRSRTCRSATRTIRSAGHRRRRRRAGSARCRPAPSWPG